MPERSGGAATGATRRSSAGRMSPPPSGATERDRLTFEEGVLEARRWAAIESAQREANARRARDEGVPLSDWLVDFLERRLLG